MSHVVYAKVDTSVVWSKGISPLGLGEVWDSEAELVVERPDLFSTTPTRVRGRVSRAPVVDAPKTASDQGEQAAEPAESAEVVDKPPASSRKAGR